MALLTILFLILLNGVLAMAEMSIVSSRKVRLERWVDEGRPGAMAALALANKPGEFLSTVQIGITTIGILNGAVGEATLSKAVANLLSGIELIHPYADKLALGIVVAGITLSYLVIGELVPKHLALRKPESVATAIAPAMQQVTRWMLPLVRGLGAATELVLRLFAASPPEPPVSDEDIDVLMRRGTEAGVFEKQEQVMVSRVLRMDDRRVTSAMTPRVDIVYLDLDDPLEANLRKMLDSAHSRFLVCRQGLEQIVGVVDVKALLGDALAGRRIDLSRCARKPLYMPEVLTVMQVLETFKKHRQQLALVVDEYGEIEGLVTMNDIMETLVGDIATVEEGPEPDIVRRDDGSLLLDGAVDPERFREATGLEERLPEERAGVYQTLGGFAMMQLGRVPQVGDKFESCGFRFEIVDMDGNRVDKLLATRLTAQGPAAAAGDPGSH